MARRLYLGRLPPDVRAEDVSKFFDGYGHIVDCRVMTGFGFVEFESSRDAEDALQNFNGKSFMGSTIVVEFAKETRPRRDPYDVDRAVRARRPPGYRLIVSGISRDTSWQDLKDFGREAGSVSYADIDRDYPGEGILEYLSREDADRAVKELDGRDLRGQPVRVALDRDVSGSLKLVTLHLTPTTFFSALEQTTVAGSPAVMIVGTTGMPVTIVTVMIVTETIATAPGMIVAIAGNALGRLLAALKSMIVAPGLHLLGGNMMTEGLQGRTPTGVGTTVDGTRRTTATMIGPRGMPTGTTDGRAELAMVIRISVFVVDPEVFPQNRRGLDPASRRICFCCMERCLVLRARRLSRVFPPFALALPGLPEDGPVPVVRWNPRSLVARSLQEARGWIALSQDCSQRPLPEFDGTRSCGSRGYQVLPRSMLAGPDDGASLVGVE
ncbi:hypothetical protein BD413DRAFT_498702 [Trametes elegans]|nr:hypothetical protein BD413DRAFT_498702 [Trametes elegans]